METQLALQSLPLPTWHLPESIALRLRLAFCFLLMIYIQNILAVLAPSLDLALSDSGS